jgi:hypothetical protein
VAQPLINEAHVLTCTQEVRWESTRTRDSKLLRSAVIFGTIKKQRPGMRTSVVRAVITRGRAVMRDLSAIAGASRSTNCGRNNSLLF